MLIIPAIDIKSGKVVRLLKGDFSCVQVYSDDPLKVAEEFYTRGIRRTHIVDLDSARGGKSDNSEIIKKIASRFKHMDIQLGGGIRDEKIIEEYFNSGIKFLIISTRAYTHPQWFISQLEKYNQRLILAVDIKGDKLQLGGWREEFNRDYLEYLKQFKSAGLKTVIYTAISQDGTLDGPDILNFSRFLDSIKDLSLEVIYSGGISSYRDIEQLRKFTSQGLKGIIIGKAIYEGKISLSQLLGA